MRATRHSRLSPSSSCVRSARWFQRWRRLSGRVTWSVSMAFPSGECKWTEGLGCQQPAEQVGEVQVGLARECNL
ncbi:hypothetical protein D3C76_1782710 [compost metagenome]